MVAVLTTSEVSTICCLLAIHDTLLNFIYEYTSFLIDKDTIYDPGGALYSYRWIIYSVQDRVPST